MTKTKCCLNKLHMRRQYYWLQCFICLRLNITVNDIDMNIKCIVAYRRIAKRWLCKHQPLLGNTSTQQHRRCHDTWHVQPLLCSMAAYACAVMPHNNRRDDACGVFCRSALRLYDSTNHVLLSEWVQCSWGFKYGVLLITLNFTVFNATFCTSVLH
jgi:hypothetical protein